MKRLIPFFILILTGALVISCTKGGGPNVLLITLDTVRADHVGSYGYRPDITPNIDGLAQEGAVFLNAFSPVPLTLPSHTTILTGTHPQYHGIHNNGNFVLLDEANTLAEDLSAAGYRTGAIIAASVLEAVFGLDQGFDTYDDHLDTGHSQVERKAEEVTRLGLEWLKKNGEEPFFLWLHYYDAHDPYDPPSPFQERFQPQPYDGEIAYADAMIAPVVQWLKERDVLDSTVILIVGDHGEGLGDHLEDTHGTFIYDTTVKVPFILRYPPAVPPGTEVEPMVETMDIRPTVLRLIGLPVDGTVQGRDLSPLLRGEKMPLRPVLLETHNPAFNYGWAILGAIRTKEWKYIQAPRPELFRVDRDQGEKDDLGAREPDRLRGMAEAYWKLLHDLDRKEGEALSRKEQMSPEMEAKLEALGYISAQEDHQDREGKDPKDMVGILQKFKELREMPPDEEDRTRKRIAILESILADDADNFLALYFLGDEYLGEKELDKAQPLLERAAAINPLHMVVHMKLGLLFKDQGDYDRAVQEYEAAQAINPNSPLPANDIANLYTMQNKMNKAVTWYRRALEAQPDFNTARINLSLLFLNARQFTEAEAELREVLRYDPNSILAMTRLGALLHGQGREEEGLALIRKVLELDPSNRAAGRYLDQWSRR